MDKTMVEQEIILRRKLDLLLRTGKILVESAADTNRIVRNMNRVAAYLGLPEENLHIDVTYTMLVVNLSDESHSYSKFQKCEKHGINMTAISEISKLSWRAIEEDYSLDRYEEELEKIKSKKRNYTPYLVAIGAGFACGGFCKLFGSDWVAFLFASIAAFAGFRVRARCIEFGINFTTDSTNASFFVQAARELGYYGYDTRPFKKYLSIKSGKGYLHRLMLPEELKDMPFDKTLSRKIKGFLQKNDPKMIFIYGENDPWTAAGVTWLKEKKNIHVFIQPGGSHLARISTLPEKEKEEVMKLLNEWLR